ncbi:uncharacterized protein LOC144291364 [Canis aureus]
MFSCTEVDYWSSHFQLHLYWQAEGSMIPVILMCGDPGDQSSLPSNPNHKLTALCHEDATFTKRHTMEIVHTSPKNSLREYVDGERETKPCRGCFHGPWLEVPHIISINILLHTVLYVGN